jgi:hypothetical protein
MTKSVVSRYWGLPVVAGRRYSNGAPAFPDSRSINFVESTPPTYDRATISVLPDGFGDGEFTFDLLFRCNITPPYVLGNTALGGITQRQAWSNANPTRYGASDWWFAGNFLLDGHNNNSNGAGTFDIQIAAGRPRWLFGDGSGALPTGGVWGIQSTATNTVLDGAWHHVACVRRWNGASNADLELWLDGVLQDTQTSNVRTNMATSYWDTWTGWPTNQQNWMFGTEKQAALGVISQYEDFKGQLGEIRFWSVARSPAALANDFDQVQNDAAGLAGVYRFAEQTGTTAARSGANGGNLTLSGGVTWNNASPFA